jgi:hypothetical protein
MRPVPTIGRLRHVHVPEAPIGEQEIGPGSFY